MTLDRSHRVLRIAAAVLAIAWWATLVGGPLMLVHALLDVSHQLVPSTFNVGTQPVSVPAPEGLQSATAHYNLADLPPDIAVPVALLWFASSVLLFLVVLWQLRRVVRGLRLRPLSPDTARDTRRLAPVILITSVLGVACQWTSSAVIAAGTEGAAASFALDGLITGLGAAAVALVFAEALRIAGTLRLEQDLTI